MIEYSDFLKISDGKKYSVNDMVKVGCGECSGCHACCQGMGNSIILDPLDVFRLCTHLNYSFEYLLTYCLELNIVDYLIMPNLKMVGKEEKCVFLNDEMRCSIHTERPGICRLFPLGRYYEDGDFSYFLQVKECKKKNRSKVKVSKWIDIKEVKRNHIYINQWHDYKNALQKKITDIKEEEIIKEINMDILTRFFLKAYDLSNDFYEQFEKRLQEGKVCWKIE